MDTTVLDLETGRTLLTDLTDAAARFCAARGDGLLHVFAPHATAGLALIETGAGSEIDAQTVLERIMPRDDDRWRHRHGSPGHGGDHVLPMLVCPFLVVPVIDGRLQLGTWQSVVLVDSNVDNAQRTVRLTFLSG